MRSKEISRILEIGRKLLYVLVCFVGLLLIPAALIAWLKFFERDRYDRDGTDYRYLTSELMPAEKQSLGLVQWESASIDTGKINGGDWQFICVIGAYNDPVAILAREAARRSIAVSSIDPVPTQTLGLSPVEENEGAISFIDGTGRGRTILIDGFQRIAGQHGRFCFGRETATVVLPLQAE
jgi:hypothetical protein